MDLDAIQQRLFAVALGLHGIRTTTTDPDVARQLEDLEQGIDDLIRDVRAGAVRQRAVSEPS